MNNEGMFEMMGGLSGGMSAFSNLVSFGLFVLLIVAKWFIYQKAGLEGWAAIVPFYSRYQLYKISGKKKLFGWWLGCYIAAIIAECVLLVTVVVALVGAVSTYGIGLEYAKEDQILAMLGGSLMVILVSCIIMLGTGIAAFILDIMQNIGLTKAFAQPGAFAVGLILLPHIFYSILAFGKSYQFVGSEDVQAPYGQAYGQQSQYSQAPVFMNEYGQQVQPNGQPIAPSNPQSENMFVDENASSEETTEE